MRTSISKADRVDPQPQTGPEQSTPLIVDETRRAMIAEAAYFRAASRGFNGGDPVEDWLGAERDIEKRLVQRH